VIAALIWRDSDPKPLEKRYEWENNRSEEDIDIGQEWQVDDPTESEDNPRFH